MYIVFLIPLLLIVVDKLLELTTYDKAMEEEIKNELKIIK